jgi:hypothetical protein
VVAKIKERLAVNKQGLHKFHMERFNLEKLNKVGGKEKYQVEVSNRHAASENWILRWKLIIQNNTKTIYINEAAQGFNKYYVSIIESLNMK